MSTTATLGSTGGRVCKAARLMLGLIEKTAKNEIKKIVKLTGDIYACKSLTSFEYEVHAMAGNGNQVNLIKLAWKKLVKSHKGNLFILGGF